MNQRDTRSYGDSHSSRKPDYDTGVQGRFGRQEDWRKVEREQAAHKLTLREQVELEAAEQKRASREAAQRRAAEQQRRRQMAQQQAAEERLRRQQQQEERRQRSKPSEPEQTIQGRFGRQEVRLNPEREARQRASQQARQYDRQRYATHERQQQAQQLRQPQQPVASREQPRAQRPVRQAPTQVEAQRQAQQRAQRQAAQEQARRHAQQQAAQQQRQVQQAHDEQQPRQEQRKRPVQEIPDDQVVQSAHGGRHMPVVQRDRQVASRPQVQHEPQDPWQIDQGDLQQEPPVDTTVAQVSQDIDQQAQPWAQQQSRTSTYRPSFGDADATSRYARESYGSKRKQGSYTVNSVGQSARSKFDRRPNIERASSERSRSGKKLPNVSPKLIAIIAAIFVVVIVVGVLNPFAQQGDSAGQGQGTVTAVKSEPSLPTPIMSESSGITMHSAVAMEDLTEILIHNASYAYANEITTQLTEAKNTDILAAHGTGRVASEQPTGDKWMTGEFIRCFREGNAGPVMSAIDCGGPVGATVYAPVTGEVVLVKQYKLYDEIDDYRIHIQPEGRPDLDVVLIHLTDVTVKPGDKVTAGVTPMAKIRDIFQYLDESLQLKNYTAENDNGNHTHIQVNNATHPEYHGLDDLKPQPAATPGDAGASTTGA